jgi:hypothetical protein
VDKVMSGLHQSWADYGSTRSHLRSACDDVVLALQDMGSEYQTPDYVDITDAYYAGPGEEVALDPNSFLYRNALRHPGPHHINDWILVQGLNKLPFWKTWMSDSQSLSSFLRCRSYRKSCQRILLQIVDVFKLQNGDSVILDIKIAVVTLKHYSASLADWRFDTAHEVSSSFRKVEMAFGLMLRFYGKDLRKQLGITNGPQYIAAEKAFSRNDFWTHG